LSHKINPDEYLKDGYDAEQLEQILTAHQKNIDIKPYLFPEMVGVQLEEIIKGLEVGIDVSCYADAKFSWMQMREIRLGLENRVDVSIYLKTLFDWKQMREIRLGLEAGYDVSGYAKLMYSVTDMRRFRKKLLENEKGESLFQTDISLGEAATSFVTISEDGMEAELNLAEPKGRAKYTEKDVLDLLKTHGVTLGIDKEVIKLLLEKKCMHRRLWLPEDRGQFREMMDIMNFIFGHNCLHCLRYWKMVLLTI